MLNWLGLQSVMTKDSLKFLPICLLGVIFPNNAFSTEAIAACCAFFCLTIFYLNHKIYVVNDVRKKVILFLLQLLLSKLLVKKKLDLTSACDFHMVALFYDHGQKTHSVSTLLLRLRKIDPRF